MSELYEQIPCEHPEATGPHTTDGSHRRWLVNPPDAVCGGPSYEPADLLAFVRRGVESGTIKGEEVEAHWSGGKALDADYFERGTYIVIGPVSDGSGEQRMREDT